MAEKLIRCVYDFPELYNVNLAIYRNADKRAQAWRRISASTGLSVEDCKRQWKNLRDRYLKELKAQRERSRAGAGAGAKKLWKFSRTLSFLDPFVKHRQPGSGLALKQEKLEGEEEEEETKAAPVPVKLTPAASVAQMTQLALLTQLAPAPQLALVTQLAPVPHLGQTRGQAPPKTPALSSPEASLLPVAAAHRKRSAKGVDQFDGADNLQDEDRLFLLSLVPALKRLPPQKKYEAKIRIQQIMFEAEFNKLPHHV